MSTISRRGFLKGLAGSGAFALGCGSVGGERAPNLVLLVTDDQRADTLGCMGNPVIRTPHIDALATDGVLFENAFVTTSLCPASRASIFTGQYMRRHGVRDFSTSLGVLALADTYPLRLRTAGYRTAFFGKWGVGSDMPRESFDTFSGFSGQGQYELEVQGQSRHLTELLASRAIRFLEQQQDDQPFCLSISFKAPHGPWRPDPSLAGSYDDETIPRSETARVTSGEELPTFLRESLLVRRPTGRPLPGMMLTLLRRYYALVSGVDVAVGRLVEALKRLGLWRGTVVVFTSDNGLLIGEHGLMGKWVMYEDSIRVPLIVHDPRLPPTRRGRRIEPMALNIDLAPTLLDLAGLPPSPAMQGRSLRPLLEQDDAEWRKDWFYEHEPRLGSGYLPTLEGVRTPAWKYVHYLDERSNRESLFDLRNDPHEMRDLSGRPEDRETLERMRARWRHYRTSLG